MKNSTINLTTGLINRSITVLERRTSVRLEAELWKSLYDITEREKCSLHELVSLISIIKREEMSLTSSIRVFIALYYKAAATETGHKNAGHGNFNAMKQRSSLSPDWSPPKYRKAPLKSQNSDIEKRLVVHL